MSDFASRFAAGSAIAGDLLDTYDTARKRKEIAAIAAAQQVGTGGDLIEGTTEAVQQQLDSGAGITEARKLASAGVSPKQYSFLGKTQDTPLDETEMTGARQQAMAGVMERFGDTEGAMRYRQQAQQGLRDAQRFKQEGTQFEWATKNQAHIEKSRVREETFNTEREKIMASSPYARVESDNQASQADYQRRLAEYNQAKTAPGMESRDMGPAPIAPTLSKVTPGQEIEHYARLFSNELGAGRVSAESAIKFHQMVNQVKNEGYGQALTLANSGAPIEKVAESFNKNGNIKLDPASVISDKMVKNADGLPSRVIQFKGADGSVHTIDTMAELNAIGAADKVYTRFYQNKADTRADEQLGVSQAQLGISQAAGNRAQKVFDVEMPVHEANAAIAKMKTKLAETEDPKEQALLSEKIAALASGRRGFGAQHDPADVNKAKALVAEKIYPTLGEALDAVVSKPDHKFQELRAMAYKNTMSVESATTAADDMMKKDGWVRSDGGTWKRAGPQVGGAPAVGAVVNGKKFKGGDPKVKGNWE